MNRYFIKGLIAGVFIGFVLTSPKREKWLQQLKCKLKRLARKALDPGASDSIWPV